MIQLIQILSAQVKTTMPEQTPSSALPLNQVIQGDCRQVLATLPDNSVDLIFADPPYNLQLRGELHRPDLSRVDRVDDAWDQFEDFQTYDRFSEEWLSACRRVLKPGGTLWVIGTYHNIYRVGVILQNLGFWILNDIVWIKTNPMPNFRGVRFTNAHETLVWAVKDRRAKYTFNYHGMKSLNDGLQMRSDWHLPICTGRQRLRVNGEKAHSTQKPESLLYRVLLAASNPGDVILDPFFGTGTSGAVAQQLGRQWIGIERDPQYVEIARQRIASLPDVPDEASLRATPNPRRQKRVAFGALLEAGLLKPGQTLYFGVDSTLCARITADASIEYNGQRGSIHQIARAIQPGPRNGWLCWYYDDTETGQRHPIDRLRQLIRHS